MQTMSSASSASACDATGLSGLRKRGARHRGQGLTSPDASRSIRHCARRASTAGRLVARTDRPLRLRSRMSPSAFLAGPLASPAVMAARTHSAKRSFSSSVSTRDNAARAGAAGSHVDAGAALFNHVRDASHHSAEAGCAAWFVQLHNDPLQLVSTGKTMQATYRAPWQDEAFRS